jgi:hypothetical protein
MTDDYGAHGSGSQPGSGSGGADRYPTPARRAGRRNAVIIGLLVALVLLVLGVYAACSGPSPVVNPGGSTSTATIPPTTTSTTTPPPTPTTTAPPPTTPAPTTTAPAPATPVAVNAGSGGAAAPSGYVVPGMFVLGLAAVCGGLIGLARRARR